MKGAHSKDAPAGPLWTFAGLLVWKTRFTKIVEERAPAVGM